MTFYSWEASLEAAALKVPATWLEIPQPKNQGPILKYVPEFKLEANLLSGRRIIEIIYISMIQPGLGQSDVPIGMA